MSYGINAPQGLVPFSSITGGSWVDKFNQYQVDPTYKNAAYSVSTFASYYNGDPLSFSPVKPSVDNGFKTGNLVPYLPDFTDGAPSTFSALPAVGGFVSCTYLDITGKLITDDKFIGGTPTYINANNEQTPVTILASDAPNIVYDIQISTHVDADGGAFTSPPFFPNINPNANLMGGIGSNFAFGIGDNSTAEDYPSATNFNTVLIPGGGGSFYNNNPATGNNISGNSAFYLDVSTYVGGVATADYNKTVATLPLKVIGLSSKNVAGLLEDGTAQVMGLTPFINVFAILNNHAYGHNVAGVSLA